MLGRPRQAGARTGLRSSPPRASAAPPTGGVRHAVGVPPGARPGHHMLLHVLAAASGGAPGGRLHPTCVLHAGDAKHRLLRSSKLGEAAPSRPPNLRPPRRQRVALYAESTAYWVGGIAHPHGLTKQAAALATKRPPRSGGAGGRRPPRPKDACARSARCAHPSTSLREAKPPKIQKCQKSQKKQKGPKDPQVFRRKTARSALLRSKS